MKYLKNEQAMRRFVIYSDMLDLKERSQKDNDNLPIGIRRTKEQQEEQWNYHLDKIEFPNGSYGIIAS